MMRTGHPIDHMHTTVELIYYLVELVVVFVSILIAIVNVYKNKRRVKIK